MIGRARRCDLLQPLPSEPEASATGLLERRSRFRLGLATFDTMVPQGSNRNNPPPALPPICHPAGSYFPACFVATNIAFRLKSGKLVSELTA